MRYGNYECIVDNPDARLGDIVRFHSGDTGAVSEITDFLHSYSHGAVQVNNAQGWWYDYNCMLVSRPPTVARTIPADTITASGSIGVTTISYRTHTPQPANPRVLRFVDI